GFIEGMEKTWPLSLVEPPTMAFCRVRPELSLNDPTICAVNRGTMIWRLVRSSPSVTPTFCNETDGPSSEELAAEIRQIPLKRAKSKLPSTSVRVDAQASLLRGQLQVPKRKNPSRSAL